MLSKFQCHKSMQHPNNAKKYFMSNPLEAPLHKLEAAAGSPLPVIGTAAVNDAKENFRRQGFAGVPWAHRKTDGRKDKGRAILVKSGHLRNSIRIVSIGSGSVTIGTDVPYARVHNEGESDYVRSSRGTFGTPHYRIMPKRQFLGLNDGLKAELHCLIREHIQEALKTV